MTVNSHTNEKSEKKKHTHRTTRTFKYRLRGWGAGEGVKIRNWKPRGIPPVRRFPSLPLRTRTSYVYHKCLSEVRTYLLDRGIGTVVGYGAQPEQRRVPGIERDDGTGRVIVHVVPVFHDRGWAVATAVEFAASRQYDIIALWTIIVTTDAVIAVAEVFGAVADRSTIPVATPPPPGRAAHQTGTSQSRITCRRPPCCRSSACDRCCGRAKLRRPPSCRRPLPRTHRGRGIGGEPSRRLFLNRTTTCDCYSSSQDLAWIFSIKSTKIYTAHAITTAFAIVRRPVTWEREREKK